jgi:signal transduction histidine kinase
MSLDYRSLTRPLAIRALLVAVGVLAGAELAFLLAFDDLPLVTIWPPLGVLVAVLALSERRCWPAYLGASFAACCVSQLLLHNRTWAKGLTLSTAEVVAAIAAVGLLRWGRPSSAFQSLTQVLDFLFRASLGIALGAAVAGSALATTAPSEDFLQMALSWWLSRTLGLILFGSLAMAWACDVQPAPPSSQILRALSGLILGCGIVWGLCAVKGNARLAIAYPLVFVPLPAYAAIMYSRKTALAVVLIVGCLGIYRTTRNAGVIVQMCDSSRDQSICIQIFVAMTALSGLAVATIVEERRAAQRENRETLRLLWQANQELESRVEERTSRLEQASIEVMEKRNLLAHASRVSTAGELAAGIAHELNQPLYAINNYASGLQHCLENRAPEVDIREVLADLRLETQRAAGILKRLRQFVKRTSYKPKSVRLEGIVEEALLLNRHELRQHGIDIAVACDGELPAVRGDAIQLQQVLVNLLRNAIESLLLVPAGERRLTISLAEAQGRLRVRVQDTGAGFADQDHARLFDPFYTTKPEGMGIGLTISRSIVEAHGGNLSAARVQPRGAAFEFTLPLASALHGSPDGALPAAPIPQPHFALASPSRDYEPADLPD